MELFTRQILNPEPTADVWQNCAVVFRKRNLESETRSNCYCIYEVKER